jgi:hypothetical protein
MRRLDSRAEVIEPVHAAQVGHSAINGPTQADDAAWTRRRFGRMQLPANDRADTVRANEQISFGAASVRQMQRHSLAVHGETRRFTTRRHRVDADGVE